MKKILLLLIIPFLSFGQESISTTGGDVVNTSGSIHYTIGQVFHKNYISSDGSIAEGVQHPYEFFSSVGQDEMNINIDVAIYPNPTNDYLTLNISSFKLDDLYLELYNLNGQILIDKKILDINTQLSIGQLSPSTYFLRITQENNLIKEFTIIKN